MTKKISLFPGSFDPLTLGHLDTIERASHLFDEVIVGIFTNTSKQSFFTVDEKVALIREACAYLPNVRVIAAQADLTVHIAQELGAKYLVRGIRNGQDLEYEKDILAFNQHFAPDIETVFFLSKAQYAHISSTRIKELIILNKNFSDFLPENVTLAIRRKQNEYKKI